MDVGGVKRVESPVGSLYPEQHGCFLVIEARGGTWLHHFKFENLCGFG